MFTPPDFFRNALQELETNVRASRAEQPPYIDEGTHAVGSDGKPIPPSRDIMPDFLKPTKQKSELHGIDQPGGPIVVDMSMTLRPDVPTCEKAQAMEMPQISEPQQVPNADMPYRGEGVLAATPGMDAQRKSVLADALATAERVASLPHPDTAFLDEVIKVAHSYGVPDTATREATAKVLEMILKNYENAAKRTLANLDSIAHVIRQKIGTLPGHEQIAAAIEHHMTGTSQPPFPTATRATKYPLLRVTWVDSRLPSSAWSFVKSLDNKESHCVSVGYRVREDIVSITLAPNVADELGGENMRVSGEIVIPRRAIISSSQAANEEWMLAE